MVGGRCRRLPNLRGKIPQPMNALLRRFITVLSLLLAPFLAGQVPSILNYQGKIVVGTTPFNGTGKFRFALVNGSGATSYWSNDGTSTAGSEPTAAVSLPVVNGLYVVPLGDATLANMTAVPATVFTNSDVWLRVWFDDSVNGSQLLAPDQRIAAVGYAMVAGSVSTPSLSSAPAAGVAGAAYFNSTDRRLYLSDGTNWQATGSSPAVYRWAVWSTYNEAAGWFANNDPSLAGGVNPSNWSDGGALAGSISADKKVQAALFNKKAAVSPSSVVWSETWLGFSSTNSKFAGALFRVRNKTGAAINWPLNFYATSYIGWGEKASIAVNGVNAWSNSSDSFVTSNFSTTLSIPANRVSTIICVAGASPGYSFNSLFVRSTLLAFSNGCLALPAGLEYVDDLDTATGGYEQ